MTTEAALATPAADKPLPLQHVLSVEQFNRPMLDSIFVEAERIAQRKHLDRRHNHARELSHRHVLYRLFYEASTRTYESFGFAAAHLGMSVLGTQSVEFSSVSKGESLEDTIRTICSYDPSVIVLRHMREGSAALAASVSSVPIINAGDGRGEHPTQTLLDLFTIQRHFKQIDGLKVVIGGDLANGRTANGLALALARLYSGVEIVGVSAPDFAMTPAMRAKLASYNARYTATTDMNAAIQEADVVYWTRMQKERLTGKQTADLKYVIATEQVESMLPGAILMHPLPRVGEILPEVDANPRAVYLTEQMPNGMFVREALLLKLVLGELS